MIRLRYLRPNKWMSGNPNGKIMENDSVGSVVMRYVGPLSYNLWVGRFNRNGYIHLDTYRKIEFIMWDDDRVKPVYGQNTDEVVGWLPRR